MGNIIPLIILLIMFSAIIYYLVYSLKTKGTMCTTCNNCTIVNKYNQNQIKQDMFNFYKNLD